MYSITRKKVYILESRIFCNKKHNIFILLIESFTTTFPSALAIVTNYYLKHGNKKMKTISTLENQSE
jgi:hypothetical protein